MKAKLIFISLFLLVAIIYQTSIAEDKDDNEYERKDIINSDRIIGQVNVKDYGVIGDGICDDTTNLQVALNIATEGGPICYLSAGQYRINGSLVVPRGPSTLTLTSCHFTEWDSKGTGAPCVCANGGRIMINGYEFMDEGKQRIVLETGLIAATIIGYLLRDDGGIVDNSNADIQIGLNTTH